MQSERSWKIPSGMLGLTEVEEQCWSLCNSVEQEGVVVLHSQDGSQLASKQCEGPKIRPSDTLKYYFLPSRCSLMSLFFCSRFCALQRSCPKGRIFISDFFREYSEIQGSL